TASGPFVFADLTNRGASDLTTFPKTVAITAADFDADGRTDLATIGDDGVLRRLRNETRTDNRWLSVALAGVKNLKLAPGAVVEVKAGASFQKQAWTGIPLVFGLGARQSVDTVRITWPNGLIQNETKQAAGAHAFKEAPRLSGSCPMIFTRDGKYEVRITEELREVSYLDAVHLLALDHPAGTEIFTNDKFKSPPFPDYRLFGVQQRIYPSAARNGFGQGEGRDVLPRLLARDNTYPEGFRHNAAGVAELHALDLDFRGAAPDGRAVLILSGWVDWADGSTFLGAGQESKEGLVFPYLQVKDAAGQWRTVIEDMGMP